MCRLGMIKGCQEVSASAKKPGCITLVTGLPFFEKSTMPSKKRKCEACHINLASDKDYVISRACIGLAE
jgi:hypothetical protein